MVSKWSAKHSCEKPTHLYIFCDHCVNWSNLWGLLFYFLSSTVFASTGDLPPPAPLLELATASYQSLKLRWTSRNTGSKTGVAGVTYTLQMLDKNGRSDCNKVLAPFLGMKPSHIFYIDWIKNECSCLVGVVCLWCIVVSGVVFWEMPTLSGELRFWYSCKMKCGNADFVMSYRSVQGQGMK